MLTILFLISQVVSLFENWTIEKIRMAKAASDNSIPPNGRKERLAALMPRRGSKPMPQAAHPGATTPKKTPMEATKPSLLF